VEIVNKLSIEQEDDDIIALQQIMQMADDLRQQTMKVDKMSKRLTKNRSNFINIMKICNKHFIKRFKEECRISSLRPSLHGLED